MEKLDRDVFEELRVATLMSQTENELPDFLAEQLMDIAEDRAGYLHLREEVADLAGQVALYDTYGQTGYLGMGVNNAILEGAIRRVKAKRRD